MNLTDKLNTLASNLWWSWQPQGHSLWSALLGPEFERGGSNPIPGIRSLDGLSIAPETAQVAHAL